MRYAPSIPVLGGSPDGEEPASFVRFVLPFGFRTDGEAAGRGPAAFVRDEPPEERTGYLTEETDRVLFGRAGWFKLEPWAPLRFPVPRIAGGGAFAVEIRQPRLVLFEWDPGDRAGQEDSLATGFLAIEAFFPDGGDQAPSLDDLLRFQELFRYWEEPFSGHDEEKGFSAVLGACPADLLTRAVPLAEAGEAAYSGRWKPLLELPAIDGDGRWSLSPSFPYGDPRAFVWTCVVAEGGLPTLEPNPRAGGE